MNHFHYVDGVLHADGVSLATLAEQVGTPFYCYATATLVRHAQVFSRALPKNTLVAFSVKSNGNLAVLSTLAREGIGADIVSGGELRKALSAGIPADKIVYSGVGKTKREMEAALRAGIHQFNVESVPELEALNTVADAMGKKAPVALRINPDVDAHTHAKITTGTAETKFGIPWKQVRSVYEHASALPAIDCVGLDVHIGSQIGEIEPFRAAFAKVAGFVRDLRGEGLKVSRLDLGGGLGVPYRTDNTPPAEPDAYGKMVAEATNGLDVDLIVEPGRLIAANAGVLVAEVLYIKEGEDKSFAILDAGMNDLIRPALYDAYHGIIPLKEPERGAAHQNYDVVGPICETADCFAKGRSLPRLSAGEKIVILSAGAYGATMASAYNGHPLAPEVLVNGHRWAVVKPRYDAQIDTLPPWL